jgi:hypothetical protein
MRNLVIVAVAVVGLAANSASAKGGGGNSAPPPPPAVHHAAPAPAAIAAPIGGAGLPHNFSSRGASYRAVPLSTGGSHTFVYPSVRNSNIHPRPVSNATTVTSLKQTGGGNFKSGMGNSGSTATVVPRGKKQLDPQTVAQLRNSGGGTSTASQARAINASHHHHHHDHDWWRHHCVALIFFDFGWWGWYDGWWYPAWGYDPYSNYEYNGPIYGANGEAPDQIVAGVQAKLQQLGYYTYAIDGKMGPLTQGAIARYQRDHHMSINSGIDQPTLVSLGILH